MADPRRTPNSRALAAQVVSAVLEDGRSISQALPARLPSGLDPQSRAFVQELSYGVLRWYGRLDALLSGLLSRPLKAKDQDLHCLLLVGLYQLACLELAPHGVVHDTVEAVREFKKPWASKLVNGVLRNFQRRQEALLAGLPDDCAARWSHPAWFCEQLTRDWPDQVEAVLAANNERPPMVLRVNQQQTGRTEYLEQLQDAGIEAAAIEASDAAILLTTPVAVDRLPGFADGLVSVQDGAAQRAATLLDLAPGQRVLDACAAPGGKTAHILERQPDLAALVALDQDPARLERVEENLERLQLQAAVVCGDAGQPADWWDGEPFDRILLDAPCTATGVIRRHPDIKWLRRPEDVAATAARQTRLLEALWPLVKPGGMLLYCTCSVLRAENVQQLERFLGNHQDAREGMIAGNWGHACRPGRQLLPGDHGGDGFYYAPIWKEPVAP